MVCQCFGVKSNIELFEYEFTGEPLVGDRIDLSSEELEGTNLFSKYVVTGRTWERGILQLVVGEDRTRNGIVPA